MQMATGTKRWTLAELHSLPDDGNKYELIRGELFVTPPPSDEHETILSRLSRRLDAYVASNNLGFLYHPRAVVRFEGSEAEPDLMVRQPRTGRPAHRKIIDEWDDAPTPILIVEVLSDSTRRRDREQKRGFYLDAGIAEYWIVDPVRREIRVARPGTADVVTETALRWQPPGTSEPLIVSLDDVFGD